MTKKVKLAFSQLEQQLTVVDYDQLQFIIGGDGDCLADTLSYIFTGTISNADYYRNALMSGGVASAVYSSGSVAYLNITNPSGFISYLNTAVSGYHVVGQTLSTGMNTFDAHTQTLAKINLGGIGPSGETVSHAVVITGRNSDGSYNYKDVVNNTTGTVQSSQIQASVTITCD